MTHQQVIEIIERYENEQITAEVAIAEIQNCTSKTTTKFELDTYWESVDLEAFALCLATRPIENWQELTDEDALELIAEILEDPCRDHIIERNSEALAKRYGKPTGTITDYIFQDDLTDPKEILAKLKVDTRIYL